MSLARIWFITAVAAVLSAALLTIAAEGQSFFALARTLEDPCEGGGYNPTPVAVTVTSVPIVVSSTTDEYFVLYVKHDVDGTEAELPVLVKLGEAGTTTLAENVRGLPRERYRVEKYLISDPADVDGDCVDDIAELNDLGNKNPVNPAANIGLATSATALPDRETVDTLTPDIYGGNLYIKFILFGTDTDRPGFNGAGLYNSYTQHPEETEDDGIDKSLKQVFASLWTFRAFSERECAPFKMAFPTLISETLSIAAPLPIPLAATSGTK